MAYDQHTADVESENQFLRRVLDVFWKADAHEYLFWRVDAGVPRLFANCSDLFMWASADLEPIEPASLGELEKAFADLRPWNQEDHVAALYAARRRGHQPMAAWFKAWSDLPAEVVAMFQAAGPPAPDPWTSSVGVEHPAVRST